MKTTWFLPLLAIATLNACSRQVDASRQPVTLAETPVQIASQAVASDAPAAGFQTVLYSEQDAEITARTNGVIKAVIAELGDAVPAGAVLGVLEDEREAAALQSAQAALELAHTQGARADALREGQMITQSDLDSVKYKEAVADAGLRDARVRLGYTRIRAPFAGRITQRTARLGQTVHEGEPLFRVTALQPLRASVRIPEQQARQLTAGANVIVRTADGITARGRVTRIAPTVDPASGTVELLVDVTQPGPLRPGSTVTVEIAQLTLRKASQ